MMSSKTIKLIVYYVTIILSERFAQSIAQIQYPSYGNQSKGTSRDVYYTTTFDKDISRRSKSSDELPIAFKAPDLGSQNFWNYDPQRGPDRRTFFEDFKYLKYGNSNVFPNLNSFFEFMSPLFDRESPAKPKQPPISKPSEPYKYEYPFKYLSSTERNFLPPPKPLRASIVKLETVTKPPNWQLPYDYGTSQDPPKQFSNYQNRPTDKTSSLYIDELGFHPDNNINFRRGSNWLTQKFYGETPILPSIFQPSDDVQTTLTPLTSTELNVTDESTSKTRKDSAKNNRSSENDFTANDDTAGNDNFNREREGEMSSTALISGPEVIEHINDEEDSKKALQLVINNTINKYNKMNNAGINNRHSKDNDTAIINENVEGTVVSKNLKSYKKSNTIKIVTDLTLEGLQKSRKDTFSVPRYTKFLNMSNLISYELNKLKQSKLMKPRSDIVEREESEVRENQNEEHKVSHTNTDGSVYDSDELSLDLKILKDTNWDGFTTPSVNRHFPTINNINLKTTITEAKTELPHLVVQSSNARNMHNNSLLNSAEKKNINNKTIIVETRVTTSISKLLPRKSRINRGKINPIQPPQEGDSMQQEDGSDRPQLTIVKADVGAQEVHIKGVENVTFPTKSDQNEKFHSEEKDKHFHKTIIRLGKTFDVLTDYSSSENQTVEGLNLNHWNRTQSRPFFKNPTSNNFSNSIQEAMLHPSSEINEQNKKSLNATIYAEETSDGDTSVPIDTSQSKKIEKVEGMHIRRRNPKRIKSKRRRTGKRRKMSATTEEISSTREAYT